jgi:hypothetical protein
VSQGGSIKRTSTALAPAKKSGGGAANPNAPLPLVERLYASYEKVGVGRGQW